MNNNYLIEENIAKANTLTSDFYTNNEYFETSKESIFINSWQLITNKKLLRNVVQYPFLFLSDFIDEPLVLINNNENIQCVSNVCTHRAHLVCLKNNDKLVLKCRYHGRSFYLNGKVKNAPGFDGVENFPTSNDDLAKIPTFVWRDFIFVSLNPVNDNLRIFDDIEKRLQGYNFDKLMLDENQSKSYIINSHWAIYCENYLEDFHIPFVHKGLTKDINLNEYKTILLENAVLQIATSSKGRDIIKLNKNSIDYGKNIYAYYYWIFPNLMLNFYNWGLSINIVKPIKKNKTLIKYLVFKFPNNNLNQDSDADVETIEFEDQKVVESVNIGINSRLYKSGRYSMKHETGVHHFHKMIAEYLK